MNNFCIMVSFIITMFFLNFLAFDGPFSKKLKEIIDLITILVAVSFCFRGVLDCYSNPFLLWLMVRVFALSFGLFFIQVIAFMSYFFSARESKD